MTNPHPTPTHTSTRHEARRSENTHTRARMAQQQGEQLPSSSVFATDEGEVHDIPISVITRPLMSSVDEGKVSTLRRACARAGGQGSRGARGEVSADVRPPPKQHTLALCAHNLRCAGVHVRQGPGGEALASLGVAGRIARAHATQPPVVPLPAQAGAEFTPIEVLWVEHPPGRHYYFSMGEGPMPQQLSAGPSRASVPRARHPPPLFLTGRRRVSPVGGAPAAKAGHHPRPPHQGAAIHHQHLHGRVLPVSQPGDRPAARRHQRRAR